MLTVGECTLLLVCGISIPDDEIRHGGALLPGPRSRFFRAHPAPRRLSGYGGPDPVLVEVPMPTPTDPQEKFARIGLFGISTLLIAIGLLFEPVGESPDSGWFELGSLGTRWLIGGMGVGLLVVGTIIEWRNRSIT